MSDTPGVIVAGGGIAGLTAALALADAGHDVRIVEDLRRPGGASRASAGMLGASLGFSPEVAPLAAEARDTYPAYLDRLRESTGITVPLDRGGIVELAEDDDALARLYESAPAAAQRLDVADLAMIDTRLARNAGGLLHPHDGAVDNVRLMDALTIAADRHPRVSREIASVIATGAVGDRVFVFTDRGARIEALWLVVAAGAWTAQIAGLPRSVPVRPVRGELMLLDVDPPPRVVYGAGGYLIPRGGKLLVGATSADDGFAATTSDEGRAALSRIASRIGGIGAARVLSQWAGLRPMSPDGLPVLGADPERPALLYATGFSRNGILFAPWAAARLALEAGGGPVPAIDPFGIARFG